MYDRILIPTDGSENVARAVDNGLALAEQFGATVHVLSVVPSTVTRDHLRHEPETESEHAVEDVERRSRDRGLDVITEVRDGETQEEILDYSEENDIDLIVMGTHGRSGIDHALLGSIAEDIVRKASMPVLTVRSDD